MEKEIRTNLETLKNIIKIYESTYSNDNNLQDIIKDLKNISGKIDSKLEC